MSDDFYRRLSTIFGVFVFAAIFMLTIFAANLEIKDLDLWLHIAMGRHIVQNHFQVPDVDILSCTIQGKPWINHEWLFQVLVYLINTRWGGEGLIFSQVLVVVATLLVLFVLGYDRRKQLASLYVLLLVALVYQDRFTIRPDLYSLMFFAVFILILSFYLDKRWSTYVLFLVQVLWSNMHGFFFFGPLFVLIGLLAEGLKRRVRLPYKWNRIGRLTDEEFRRLRFIFVAVILASLCNPYTFRGAWYPLGVFFQISGESRIFFDKIIELQKPIAIGNLWTLDYYPYYRLLILLSFLSFVFNRRKIDLGTLIFWLVFLFFSLVAIRNLIYFAFAAYLAFVTNATSLSLRNILPFRITDKKFVYIASTFVKLLLTVWIMNYFGTISTNGYYDFDRYERKSEFGGISQRSYPDKAADFLVANNVSGNFFNDFNSGAYLLGRCFPKIRVFIDGRTEVYGPQFFKYYQDLWERDNPELFGKMLDRFQITGVLLNSVHQPIPRKVLKHLYDRDDWVPVYFDYDAMIFLKDIPLNREVIAGRRLDLEHWQVPQMDLVRLGSQQITPYRYVNRAFTLMDLGLMQLATVEAREALKINPAYSVPYRVLGLSYAGEKEDQKAFEHFRIAVMLSPQDQVTRMNLGMAYENLGWIGLAADTYQKILDRKPPHPKAYYSLSRALAKLRKYPESLTAMKKAPEVSGEDVLRVADIVFANEGYEESQEFYRLALKKNPKLAAAYIKLAELNQRLGRPDQARKELQQAIEIMPDEESLKKELEKYQGI